MKNIHISDLEWSIWLSGDQTSNTSAIDSHLAICEQCRAEGDRMRSLLSDFPGTVHKEAARDEAFWIRQRADILQQAESRKMPFGMRWMMPVPAVALLLLVVLIFMRSPTPKTIQVQSNDARDEALLLEVQNDSYRQVPSALAPAGLLVEERNRVLSSKKSQAR
jgi:hypothetical protein